MKDINLLGARTTGSLTVGGGGREKVRMSKKKIDMNKSHTRMKRIKGRDQHRGESIAIMTSCFLGQKLVSMEIFFQILLFCE